MRNVLVLCKTNSVVSPIVEALFNANPESGWRAFSAGSEPALSVNAYTIGALKESGVAEIKLKKPQNWAIFAGSDAPRFDVVLTVSEDVDWADMPVWNGAPRYLHWSLPDPRKLESSPLERKALFAALVELAQAKVDMFVEEERLGAVVTFGANDNRTVAMRKVGA